MSDNAGCIPDSPFDFILRSRDGTDFHVHKETLKFTSDVFADMSALPMETCELSQDGIPVLVLPEPHAVLLRLLRLVGQDPHMLDLGVSVWIRVLHIPRLGKTERRVVAPIDVSREVQLPHIEAPFAACNDHFTLGAL
ncbi:hypothetical protein DFH09DRAFT_1346435 [Mycena vulgaris]|nr:hypothetical protein DFH09DRAFT_1346435 [Mycena vulgaris]